MAPRFVVVVNPVDEGVAWARSLGDRVGNFVPENATRDISDTIQGWLHNATNTVSNYQVAFVVNNGVHFVLSTLPPPRDEARYLFLASIIAAALRCIFVYYKARSIMIHYGASKRC